MAHREMQETYTVAEAARYLGVNRQRVEQFISEGRLQARRHGASWLIQGRDLAEFGRIPRRMGRPPKSEADRVA